MAADGPREKLVAILANPNEPVAAERGRRAMDKTGYSHRLAAILAADAAGYSRLMAADEHATLTALDAARAVVPHADRSPPWASRRHGR